MDLPRSYTISASYYGRADRLTSIPIRARKPEATGTLMQVGGCNAR